MYQFFLSQFYLAFLSVWLTVAVCNGQDFANDIVDREQGQKQADNQDPAASAPPDVAQQNAANRARVVAALIKEMNELIPGDYQNNAPQQALLVEMANAFVQVDANAVDAAFNRLAEQEPNLPPRGLLLAGANFTISNAAGGQALLERTAMDHPSHPSIPLAFSRLAISQGRLSDALALVEKSARQMTESKLSPIEQRHYLIETTDVQQIIAKRQNRIEDALVLVGQWEQLDPTSPKMMIARAEVEFQTGDIEKSQNYLRKFRAVVPDSRPTELVLATWFQQKGDVKGTEEWVKRAAANYPDNPDVQLELGNWAISQEDFDTAEKAIATVEAKQGGKPNTDAMKARIAFAKGDYSQAEKRFELLYQQQPNSFDISNMYVLALAESPDDTKKKMAIQLAQRNLQGLPNNHIAQSAFGWALLKSGNVQDAKTLFSRVARVQRLPPEIAYYLAVILEQDGKSDQAKQLLQTALKSQGMFLYRSKAKEMLDRIETGAGLPDPNQ